MIFENGMNVVYKNVGVCTIEDIEKRNFDGINDIEYYKLKPIANNSAMYYVPVQNSDEQIRELFSKDEVNQLIDNMQNENEIWFNNSRERRINFGKILKSDDYKAIIGMIKALYMQKNERQKHNKSLSSSDETLLNSAERLMFQEFAMVLNINQEDMKDYIINRIG